MFVVSCIGSDVICVPRLMLKAEYETSVLDCDSFVVIIFVLSKGFSFFCPAFLFYGKKPTFPDYLSVSSSGSQGNPREDWITMVP